MKQLWDNIQNNPAFMQKVNGWLTVFWIVMVPVSIATGWVTSVAYVSALSLWALVTGHLSAWQAARVETHQDEDNDVAEVMEAIRRLDARLCEKIEES